MHNMLLVFILQVVDGTGNVPLNISRTYCKSIKHHVLGWINGLNNLIVLLYYTDLTDHIGLVR
jgi:hypothetical protein